MPCIYICIVDMEGPFRATGKHAVLNAALFPNTKKELHARLV